MLIRSIADVQRRVPGRGADDRGRGAVRGDAARARRGRAGGLRVLQRPGAGGGSSPLLRDGGRVRDALPDAARRVWRSRAGATSSSRPPRARGRWWWGIRAARARRSWTARPASSWTAGARARWATRWPACSADPDLARRMGEAGRARVERAHTWPRIAETLAALAPDGGRLRVLRRSRARGYPGSHGGSHRGWGERRCPTCGALVSADASWCGQCFTPIRERAVEVGAPTAPEGAGTRRGGPGHRRARRPRRRPGAAEPTRRPPRGPVPPAITPTRSSGRPVRCAGRRSPP